MQGSHLLVLAGGDLLQEVCDALALRASKAQALEELHHVLSGAMIHQVACMVHALKLRPMTGRHFTTSRCFATDSVASCAHVQT